MFIEEIVNTKVQREYNVVVCGGGFAGISAASMTDDFSAIDIKELQPISTENGVKLHGSEML